MVFYYNWEERLLERMIVTVLCVTLHLVKAHFYTKNITDPLLWDQLR